MRYEVSDETLTFYLDNPKRAEEAIAAQSFAGSGLSGRQIVPLAESVLKKYRGAALGTQRSLTTDFFRPFFSYFETQKTQWPKDSTDWQIAIYGFFQFYLSDMCWSQARAKFRMRAWQVRIGGLLRFLIEEEVIPRDVVIPDIDQQRMRVLAKDQSLLGQLSARPSALADPPKKLLVDVSFGMADAEYLNNVENKCRKLVGIIRDTCQGHWDRLMKDGETGRALAQSVTDSLIEKEMAEKRFGSISETSHCKCLYASAAHPQGHNWALAITRYKIATDSTIDCVSVPTLRASPFFRNASFGHEKDQFKALRELTALTPEQQKVVQIPAQFYRFARLLSNIDAAAACCLLTIEHPEFTSESLRDAKLLNVHGKPYLLLTDSGDLSIFSVDKPRAGNRKAVVLTPRSQRLVQDILEWTAPVRELLKRAGDKTWRYLFLGVKQREGKNGILGVVESRSMYLNGGNGTTALTTLYPVLSQNGLNRGSFDFRRLRNTLGIIRWFETGSILEMSRRLGNTRKVALEHYLPPALLHAWNTRIIRRFQNTLIVLAAHDEPYLLEVTDFSTMSDIQHFIAQLVVDYPARTSPLADEVQVRMGTNANSGKATSATSLGLLNVRLSPKSLAFLYSYSELSRKVLAANELEKVDVMSGLAPQQFIDMATLLRHAAETGSIHVSLSESLDVSLLKQIHGEALAMQVGISAQFEQIAIKHRWA